MDLWEFGHIARIDIDTDRELSRRAIDRIFAASGAHAIYESSDLQRVHRDIHTACHHAIIDFDALAEMAAPTMLLGDPSEDDRGWPLA